MKKKAYVALLSLCCPIMLNTQQVFAEETAAESVPTSESVAFEDQLPEGGPEELPADPAPEVSEEAPEETEETEGSTEEAEDALTEETEQSEETVESTESIEAEVKESEEPAIRALQLMTFTITFVDEAGTVIASQNVSEEVGTVIGIALPTNGYFVVDTPVGSGFSVELDDNMNPVLVGEITSASADFIVTMRAFNASGDAQINFVDEAGNPMIGAPSVQLGGEVGEVVSYDPPVIPGYTYSGGTVSVTLSDTLQTIDVVYTRIETTLTVSYRDISGNQLAPDETYTGKFGEVYEFTPAAFSGMELINMNGMPLTAADLPVIVTMGETNQEMMFVYQEQGIIEPAPYQPSQVDPAAPIVEVKQEIKPLTDKKTLPETGEKENMVVAAAGMILVAQAAYVLKKKKENEFGL